MRGCLPLTLIRTTPPNPTPNLEQDDAPHGEREAAEAARDGGGQRGEPADQSRGAGGAAGESDLVGVRVGGRVRG